MVGSLPHVDPFMTLLRACRWFSIVFGVLYAVYLVECMTADVLKALNTAHRTGTTTGTTSVCGVNKWCGIRESTCVLLLHEIPGNCHAHSEPIYRTIQHPIAKQPVVLEETRA